MSISENIPAFEKLHRQSCESSQRQHRRSATCIITTNDTNNVLPNYLRASIGSCHDYCKFGLKPDLNKTIERYPSVKRSPVAPLLHKSLQMAKDDTFFATKKVSFTRSQSVKFLDKKAPISPKPSVELKKKPQMRSKEPNILINQPKGTTSGIGMMRSVIKTDKGTGISKMRKETENEVKVQKPVLSLKAKKKGNSSAFTQSPTRKSEAKAAPKKLNFLKSKKERKQLSNDDEDVPEKIIHVIEMSANYSEEKEKEKEKQILSPVCSPQVPTPQNMRDLFITPQTKEEKDQESQSPRKMKFRKGTEIDVQSEGNDTGSRIKFRKLELLESGENQQNGVETVSLKSTENLETGKDQSEKTTKEIDEVILRDQHPVEKEQTESLYNNVIKKTARKLVKTKKSKVKALVNAFETIISLHDEKSHGKVSA